MEPIYGGKLGTQQSYPMGLLKPKNLWHKTKVFDAKVWEFNPDSEVENREDH